MEHQPCKKGQSTKIQSHSPLNPLQSSCSSYSSKKKEKKRNTLVGVIKDLHVIKSQWSVSVRFQPSSYTSSLSSGDTIHFTLSSRPLWFSQPYTLVGPRARASNIFASPSTCAQQRLLLPPQNSCSGKYTNNKSWRGCGEKGRSEERRVGKECRSRWSPDH